MGGLLDDPQRAEHAELVVVASSWAHGAVDDVDAGRLGDYFLLLGCWWGGSGAATRPSASRAHSMLAWMVWGLMVGRFLRLRGKWLKYSRKKFPDLAGRVLVWRPGVLAFRIIAPTEGSVSAYLLVARDLPRQSRPTARTVLIHR